MHGNKCPIILALNGLPRTTVAQNGLLFSTGLIMADSVLKPWPVKLYSMISTTCNTCLCQSNGSQIEEANSPLPNKQGLHRSVDSCSAIAKICNCIQRDCSVCTVGSFQSCSSSKLPRAINICGTSNCVCLLRCLQGYNVTEKTALSVWLYQAVGL